MMDYIDIENDSDLSFLHGRDSSILAGNLVMARDVPVTNINETSDVNIRIYLRVKGEEDVDDLYEINNNEIHCIIPPSISYVKNMKDVESVAKKFTFSHIFPPTSIQEEIFNLVVKPKVLQFINGHNSTLMSYGASGSGKTFTVVGTTSEPGIIPRTLEYLFRTLPEISEIPLIKPTECGKVEILSKTLCQEEVKIRNNLLYLARSSIGEEHTSTYQEMQDRLSTEPVGIVDGLMNLDLAVWVSFAEIYNENIYDLLAPIHKSKGNERPRLKLASFNENTYIKHLRNVSISSGIEAYQILQYGLHNLKYASTSINSHSSRSHCIFTIKVAQVVKGTDTFRLNYFNFCDLAGSERLKKTLNVGDRLKESNNINTSLLILGRCISSMRENQKRNTNKVIPYRESKLTRLFQRALSGWESISMIVNINPSKDMFEESLHVLNFSAIARDIIVRRSPVKLNRKKLRLSSVQIASNIFDDIPKETEQPENNKLQDIIDMLCLELEEVNKDRLEEEARIREEVVREQAVIIDDMRRRYQERIAALEARHREHITELRDMYRNNSVEESEVINLDSSSDEEECKNNIDEYKCAQQESNLEIAVLKSELLRKDKEINELKERIADAETTYDEMRQCYEERLNNLITENYKLEETNSELSAQVDDYSRLLCRRNEEILGCNL